MESAVSRWKVTVLGGEAVGKTALVKRFLFDSFAHLYIPTVEEMYCRKFSLSPDVILRASILDTSGRDEFPAMRRHAILSSHAFIIVYSVSSPDSLHFAQERLAEIRDLRGGRLDVPVVLVGNKVDLRRGRGYLFARDGDWLVKEFPGYSIPLLECSARDNKQVTNVFRTLLEMSEFSPLIKRLSPDMKRINYSQSPALSRRITWSKGTKERSSSCTHTNTDQQSIEKKQTGMEVYLETAPRKRSRSLIKSKKKAVQYHDPQECRIS